MSRIVAGTAGGRRLAVPPGRRTRPTADRTREALFSALEALVDGLAGRRFADLYAGSGAVGLEALSRGAAYALLVESDPVVLRTLRANVAALGLPGAEVRADRVERVLAGHDASGRQAGFDASGRQAGFDASDRQAGFDIVFADPPYADDVEPVLRALLAGDWLLPGAVVVLERSTRGGGPVWPDGLEPLRSRRYGEATLWYGRRS